MEGFTIHRGTTAVLPDDNVDTDRIIPARFLSRVSRSGYGELLFSDVRGEGFPLDQPAAQGATVLVVGTNFGCGSSREHAVWAIQQAGFKAVVAKRTETSAAYSDIFRQNAANCGLLLVELTEEDHDKISWRGSGVEIEIDLPSQLVRQQGEESHFDISPVSKEAILKGLDLIGTTLIHEKEIGEYESKSIAYVPQR
ncbi:MAG: 3-isopropylmalate dehydratase small subunit [Armatimonadetes bacterium 55-13]|nr:3-isopropylmalate dehydratase small subunit [Armatimonadota bacterium]OJU63465.1 MAG: 3-isopropylmalate dehydratase small subunit [Armatimonadetes bacterium 55-13]